MHTLQTDGDRHRLPSAPVQKALGWLVNLAMEEGTPGQGELGSAGPSAPGRRLSIVVHPPASALPGPSGDWRLKGNAPQGREKAWRWWHRGWCAGQECLHRQEVELSGTQRGHHRGKSMNPGVDRATRSPRTRAELLEVARPCRGRESPCLQQQRGGQGRTCLGPRRGRNCPGKQLQGLAQRRGKGEWPWDATH